MDKKKRIKSLNQKARAIEALAKGESKSVEALAGGGGGGGLNMPVGCTTIFDPGWETNPRANLPVGNCQSSAHDYLACAGDCWWPAQVPDGLTNAIDFDKACPSVARDWREIEK
jgi:hypothetical protein